MSCDTLAWLAGSAFALVEICLHQARMIGLVKVTQLHALGKGCEFRLRSAATSLKTSSMRRWDSQPNRWTRRIWKEPNKP